MYSYSDTLLVEGAIKEFGGFEVTFLLDIERESITLEPGKI